MPPGTGWLGVVPGGIGIPRGVTPSHGTRAELAPQAVLAEVEPGPPQGTLGWAALAVRTRRLLPHRNPDGLPCSNAACGGGSAREAVGPGGGQLEVDEPVADGLASDAEFFDLVF